MPISRVGWHVVHTDYDGEPLCVWIKPGSPGHDISWFESPCGMYRIQYDRVKEEPYIGMIPGMFLRPFGERRLPDDWDPKLLTIHDPSWV